MNHNGLYFEDEGDGPSILFLHAFPLDLTMWDRTASACVSHGYRAVRVDLPGFGKSRKTMTTLAQAALDVAAVVRKLELDLPVVCGLSMGGYVTFELLRSVPEFFSAAVLCDTVAGIDSPEKRSERLATVEIAGTEQFADFVEGFIDTLLSPKSVSGNPDLPKVIRKGFERAGPKSVSAAQIAMANRRSSEDILPTIKKPVCLVYGEEDPMRSAGTDILNSVEGAELYEVKGAGHFSNLENPSEFNSILLSFLEHANIGI